MSAIRAARPIAANSALRAITRPALSFRSFAFVAPRPSRIALARPGPSFRYKVTRSKFAQNPLITYEELKPIADQPNDDVLLVDVRERDENALGSIPSAVNIPLSELKEALDEKFNPQEFRSRYTFEKPLPEQNMVFFCRSGKRSATAAELAGEKGYHNIRNYQGSWLDWSKRNQGSGFKDDDDD